MKEVKGIKEIKGLKSLPVKVDAYPEHKRLSMMELFCENS